jgi:transposase
MSKVLERSQATVFVGIDVSAATLAAAVQQAGRDGFRRKEFANSASGHKRLIAWLLQCGDPVRVSLEATGTYSLDVALALDGADGIEVAVLNPKTMNRFAQTLRRSKTDAADAQALSEYSRRMEFVPWQRPSRSGLELRTLSRHIATLTEDHTRWGNRLHAVEASKTTPRCVLDDLKRARAAIAKRILKLRQEAVTMVERDPQLRRKFQQLNRIKGIGGTSAVQLLGELAGLDPGMTVRQWVAYSGLDPVHQISGSSVRKQTRISRHGNSHLRRALYIPALVGARHDPHMKAFYELLQTRHKTKLQALVAVARKLLHAIFGIFKSDTDYNGAKLFPHLIPTS